MSDFWESIALGETHPYSPEEIEEAKKVKWQCSVCGFQAVFDVMTEHLEKNHPGAACSKVGSSVRYRKIIV